MKNFDSLYIEITNICNLSCSFCPGTKREKAFIDIDLFIKILSAFKDRCSFIHFHVMGEPLLHPHLKNLLFHAHNKGHRVNITTNGIMLKDNISILKKSSALRQVNVSLHWLAEVEDENYVKNYMKDLFQYINETKNKDDYYIALRLWNMEESGFNSQNKIIAQAIEDEFKPRKSILDTKATYKGILLDKNIFLNHDTAFQWPVADEDAKETRKFCKGLRNQIAILVDGTVVPCCLDNEGTINLGNIKNSSLDTILTSDRAKKIYEGFSQGKAVEALCRGCGYKSLF